MTDSRMKWALLIIFTFLTVLALLLPIAIYFLTRNWLALAPAVGNIPLGFAWTWITKRVFPLNERDHKRELTRMSAPTPRGNATVPLVRKHCRSCGNRSGRHLH